MTSELEMPLRRATRAIWRRVLGSIARALATQRYQSTRNFPSDVSAPPFGLEGSSFIRGLYLA